MKILIVSDSHGNTNRLETILSQEEDAYAVIFLGDGLRDMEWLEDAHPSLRVYSVRGNCDIASFAPVEGLAPFGGVLVYYTHGHLYNVKSTLEELADTAKARGADVALYGHTHHPLLKPVKGVTTFNPGAVSGSATYGIMTVQDGHVQFEYRSLP